VAESDPVTAALPDEYARLENAVRQLADELAGYRARARLAEARAGELERALMDVSSGALDPVSLRDRLRDLERENRALRHRMVEAQERVRRLVARFEFLREDM
jgi:chromosome segregation ATPase